MARAIVRNPRLFLMDEPLSNLDARLRSEVRDSIMALHQQLKTSTIYVTHDQTEAMSMADRIVVMNGGHVQQVGRPEYLYANPANLFVAGFIGSPAMNLLSLPCANGEVLLGEQRYPLPPRHRDQTRVWLGVRPEHITDRVEEGHLRLPATVLQRELMGPITCSTSAPRSAPCALAAATAARCRRKASRYRSAFRLPMCIFSC